MGRAVVVSMLLAMALVAAGCGRSERTYSVPGGRVKVTQKSGHSKEATVEMETGKGKATVTTEKKTITEAELGAPVYPGAEVVVSGKYEGNLAAGEGTAEHYTLSTKDSFDKVAAFYKSHLKNIKGSYTHSQGDQQMAMFQVGDKGELAVNVVGDPKKGETMIQVMKQSR